MSDDTTKPTVDEPTYPCVNCGRLRNKDEGGTVFSVCDECWNKNVEPTRDPSHAAECTCERCKGWEREGRELPIPAEPASEPGEAKKPLDPFRPGLWFCGGQPFIAFREGDWTRVSTIGEDGTYRHSLPPWIFKGEWTPAVPASALADKEREIERLRSSLIAERKATKDAIDAVETATVDRYWFAESDRLAERCHTQREEITRLRAELSRMENSLSGVQGALADAGTVLCNREDGDYGASVREVVDERDRLKAELAEARRAGEEAKANQTILLNCAIAMLAAGRDGDGLLDGVQKLIAKEATAQATINKLQERVKELESQLRRKLASKLTDEQLALIETETEPAKPEPKDLSCEVESVTDDEIICWVQVNGEFAVKTAFPRRMVSEQVLGGQELIWNTAGNSLVIRRCDNADLLAELDKLGEVNQPAKDGEA